MEHEGQFNYKRTILPHAMLEEALIKGELARFMELRPALTVPELAKRSGISITMWNMWIEDSLPVSKTEVNEIVRNIRRYERKHRLFADGGICLQCQKSRGCQTANGPLPIEVLECPEFARKGPGKNQKTKEPLGDR